MKKRLGLLVGILFGTTIGFAQVPWRFKTGLAFSKIGTNYAEIYSGSDAGESLRNYEVEAVAGISVGLGPTLQLNKLFSIQPTLVFARRGFKQSGPSDVARGNDFKAQVSYFELPVDLVFSSKIGAGNLFLGLGPYLGYGAGGKWKTAGPVFIGDMAIDNSGDITFQNDNSYGTTETFVYGKPWDYGAQLKVGYTFFKQYSILLEWQRGLANIHPRWSDYKSAVWVKNQSFGISLAYSLNY